MGATGAGGRAPRAPIGVVAAVARSDGRGDGGVREEGSGPDGALVAGDEVEGEVSARGVARYRLVGEGAVVVGVRGVMPFDAYLEIRDDDGDVVAESDDVNGLDPEVEVDIDGELTIHVRGFDDAVGGSFRVYVE